MDTNLQNDVPEPVAFAYPFSFCIPEGGWVSTPMSVVWGWEKSWIFILPSLQKHLLSCFDGVGVETTHPGTPFPCEQPRLVCGKSAGGRSTVFYFDLPQNARLSSAGDLPTTILSLGTVFSVLSSLCKCWSGFLCSLLDVEAGVFCSGNQVFKVRLELILCK